MAVWYTRPGQAARHLGLTTVCTLHLSSGWRGGLLEMSLLARQSGEAEFSSEEPD